MEIKQNLLPWFGRIALGNLWEVLRDKAWTFSEPDKCVCSVFAMLKKQILDFVYVKYGIYHRELHLPTRIQGSGFILPCFIFSEAGSHRVQVGLKLEFSSRLVLTSWSFSASSNQVLGLQTCTTTPSFKYRYFWYHVHNECNHKLRVIYIIIMCSPVVRYSLLYKLYGT